MLSLEEDNKFDVVSVMIFCAHIVLSLGGISLGSCAIKANLPTMQTSCPSAIVSPTSQETDFTIPGIGDNTTLDTST
jgi:hypothetical protein